MHDCEFGNYNLFNPGVNLSGGIEVENEVLLGTGAQVLQYLKIEEKSTIGAGSVVTKNVDNNSTYVGIPAGIPT